MDELSSDIIRFFAGYSPMPDADIQASFDGACYERAIKYFCKKFHHRCLLNVLLHYAVLTHLFPMQPFSTLQKHQKIVRERERVEKGCIGSDWLK